MVKFLEKKNSSWDPKNNSVNVTPLQTYRHFMILVPVTYVFNQYYGLINSFPKAKLLGQFLLYIRKICVSDVQNDASTSNFVIKGR